MAKASDNAFPSILITEGTEPSAPAAGKQRLYIDSTTHKLKRTDSSGTDVTIESSGAVASDTIWDAKGDLAAGTGADAAAKVTVGTNGSHLEADSAQSTGVAWVGGPWTDYSPTMTGGAGFNIGSSTLIGRYKLLDAKTVWFQVNFIVTTGGAWNAGAGSWTVTLPPGCTAKNVANRTQLIPAHVLDSGTTNFVCVGKVVANGTTISETNVADGTNPRNLTNAAPITWATGDQVNWSGLLEIE